MTDSPPDEHTYEVRCGETRIAYLRGTTVNVESTGTLAIWNGRDPVGLYPAHSHSVTRLTAGPAAGERQ